MKYLNLLLLISLACLSYGQAIGDLDLSFGDNGIIVSPEAGTCYVIELQQDGKIVAAGSGVGGNFAINRYNFDGTLDTSFSNDGMVLVSTDTTNSHQARAILIQDDGKIIIGGNDDYDADRDFVLVRLYENGKLDSSFGNNGFVISPFPDSNDELRAAVIQPGDGKIIVSGTMYNSTTDKYELGIIRYYNNGIIDSSFSGDGIQLNNFDDGDFNVRTMALQEDGKIIVGGFDDNSNFSIVRYQTDGSLDIDFGLGGIAAYSYNSSGEWGESLAIQNDGKIILAGWWDPGDYADSQGLFMRVNSDGSLDHSFGIEGFADIDFGYDWDRIWSIEIQDDGKIIGVGGSNSRFAAVRYNQDGKIDSTFGYDGYIFTKLSDEYDLAYDIAIQPDGNFILAGQADSHFGLARYINDANVVINNFTEIDISLLLYPNPISSNATLQFTLLQDDIISIYIHNIAAEKIGSVIENKKLVSGEYTQTIQISESLPAGNYLIILETNNSKSGIEFTKL